MKDIYEKNLEEWVKWKKSLDPNFIYIDCPKDDHQEKIGEQMRKEEEEVQRQREFAAFYNHI